MCPELKAAGRVLLATEQTAWKAGQGGRKEAVPDLHEREKECVPKIIPGRKMEKMNDTTELMQRIYLRSQWTCTLLLTRKELS